MEAPDRAIQPADRVGRDLEQLRRVTGQVVGSVFFGTLLKSMRESNLKGSIGHGGRGEEVFAAQLHGIWAEQAGQASEGRLTRALYGRLAEQQRRISQSGGVGMGASS
jgi:hypothetical protein